MRFTGTAVTVASFAFQVIPVAITYLSPPYDVEYKLFLVFAVYLPAALFLIVLQARFLSNAIENLQLFKTGITAEPNQAWASAIPFVNFFVTPWLIFTVHERSMSLAPERGNTSDRSGYLTLVWWGTFIGAFVANAIAEGQPTPDGRIGGMLFGTAVGMVSSFLTKRVIGEIMNTQEARAGLSSHAAAAGPATVVEPAKPATIVTPKPTPPEPAPTAPKPPEARVETAEAKEPPQSQSTPIVEPLKAPQAKPLTVEAPDTIALCPKCGAGTLASEGTAGIVTCPMCGNIFDADSDAEDVPAPPVEVREPAAASRAPVEKAVKAEGDKPRPHSEAAAQLSGAAREVRPPASLVSKLAALAFAVAAPLGTFMLASEWGDVSDYATSDFEVLRTVGAANMLKAAALALTTSLIAADVFTRVLGRRLGGIEAFLIWFGCALTLTLAVGLLFNHHRWLALGDGPDRYFFGGLPFGLAIAAATGIVVYLRWHRALSRPRPRIHLVWWLAAPLVALAAYVLGYP